MVRRLSSNNHGLNMEKKEYMQPCMKIILMPRLLQEFELSGGGNAGEAAAKRHNGFDDTDEESENIWNFKW